MISVPFVLLLLVVLFLPILTSIADSRVLCIKEEKNALLDFKLSFTADPQDALSTWSMNNTECCEWSGLICDTRTGHVVSLHPGLGLESNELRPSLLELKYLSILDLGQNKFTMRIPEFIGSLINLTHLDLSYSGFFGDIPPNLGNLTKLQTLALGSFSSGLMHTDNLEWLSHLSSLEMLDLSGVNLSNVTDGLSAFKMLPSLSFLFCSSCSLPHVPPISSMLKLETLYIPHNLIDKLPDLSKLSCLTELDASYNRISGNLDAFFHNLPKNLTDLDLSANSLNGVVSDAHLSKFSNLQSLDLSENYLLTFNFSESWVPAFQLQTLKLRSCKLPRFPNWVLTQTSLYNLDISNSSVSGAIPSSFWYYSTRLFYLNVSNNKVECNVPNLSLSFENYPIIDLSSNDFHGPIPSFMFSATELDLSNNKFSSFSPFHHELLSGVGIINLCDNLILGSLPNWIFQFDGLVILNLANNMLSGTIPSNIGYLRKLNAFHVNNNTFSGKLPSSMRNCTELMILELGNNNFSGSLPFWLGDSLLQLIVLNLRSNNFSRDLPSNLCQLKSLQVLDLSGNRISGSIPGCVNNFTSMAKYEGFNVSSYADHLSSVRKSYHWYILDFASIIWKGILAIESSRNLPQFNVIDLSDNCLTGEIPISVTSLKYLRSLDLSRNKLDGSIPSKIGQLTFLEVLKLSSNELCGEIPKSLDGLTFLNTLNLSCNNLSGRIPTSTQLQSFDASSYAGNSKLCGEPLPNKFPGDNKDVQKQPPFGRDHSGEEANEPFDLEAFYAALGAGFAFSFLGILGLLHFHAKTRHTFFQMANDVVAWIFLTTSLCQSRIKRRLCV